MSSFFNGILLSFIGYTMPSQNEKKRYDMPIVTPFSLTLNTGRVFIVEDWL